MSKDSRIDALDAELKDFVRGHIHGWSHDHWGGLLAGLAERGHDVSDQDLIGLRLERAHILATLERLELKGVGAKRRERLADHFPTLWKLRHAEVEELAAVPTFHRSLAEALHAALTRRTGGF